MQLSVVILNYNVKDFLQLCLQSVEKAIEGLKAEIIVVDNASVDGSMAMVAERFPTVKRIENTTNVGFSKANNQAVQMARGKFVCILNPDTVVPEDVFQKLLSYVELVPKFGAIGVQLIDGKGQFLPESKRQLPTPKVAFQKLIGQSKNYYDSRVDTHNISNVAVLVGAFMFMRRDRYNQVGGFDEDYFMYGEDIDLSYKLTKAGYTNYYNGQISVIHFKGESTSKDKTYQERFYAAMRLFYSKHFSEGAFQSLLVSKGLALAKTLKSLKPTSKAKHKRISTYLYIGQDERVLNAVSKLKDKAIENVTINELSLLKLRSVQLILDAGVLSYQEIINLMQTYNGHGNTFRIKPVACNYILGSDTSVSKGEILQLTLSTAK